MPVNFKVKLETLQQFVNDSDFLEQVPLHIYEDCLAIRNLLERGVSDIQSVTVDAELFEWIMIWKEEEL